MLRLLLISSLAFAGCHHEPGVMSPKDGELPPLPPASGTAVGYLVDSASQLDLRADQLKKLKDIDASLAARNDVIDTQLRTIEKPLDDDQGPKGAPPARHNNAPGAQIKTTGDAGKLHNMKTANDKDALDRAFAVLDPPQQEKARKLLDDRGILAPGSKKPKDMPKTSDDGGVPLEP